mmetsp:Transcript_20308/g.51303  ORF Transcript_20308/g.51303 Transcript_20308/m.51303 type:complete len:222 (+) Transcript_20308:66-731(+)
MLRALPALFVSAAALEPFVPPIAVQDTMQASLPEVVDIHFDVPKAGLTRELEALKSASFLKKGKTDVWFAAPGVASEADYAAVLAQLKSTIDSDFQSIRAAATSGASFLKAFPSREPSVNVMVASGPGKKVDMARLSADGFAYAATLLAGLEKELTRTSFLSGDEVPRPMPVLNVDLETASYISPAEISSVRGEMAAISGLEHQLNSEYSTLAGVRAKGQK